MSSEPNPRLETRDLSIGYRPRREAVLTVAESLSLALHPGELICLLGPNGSGKSTLVRTLSGMQPPLSGTVRLSGENLSEMPPRKLAKSMSTVLTDRVTAGHLTVWNLVAFGRSPHTGWLGTLRQEDHRKVAWAIRITGLESFADRDITRLSDGERQKVMIARSLAQDTPWILLDEPTAHLDLPNRVEIIQLLRSLAHETGKGILASTHELDLALKAADRIWLMNGDRSVLSGVPEDLVLDGTFERVFQRKSFRFDRSTGSFTIHREPEREVRLKGDPVAVYWTRRALEREGCRVTDGPAKWTVRALEEEGRYRWEMESAEQKQVFSTVSDLIRQFRSSGG